MSNGREKNVGGIWEDVGRMVLDVVAGVGWMGMLGGHCAESAFQRHNRWRID